MELVGLKWLRIETILVNRARNLLVIYIRGSFDGLCYYQAPKKDSVPYCFTVQAKSAVCMFWVTRSDPKATELQ
jgi:hypothetical protein